MSSMDAARKKYQRAAEHMSPDYHFQGMALTYRRPGAAMMQRATRMVQPSRRAVEAAARTSAKRVHFAPLVGEVADATISEAIQNDPLLAPLTDAPDPDVPGVPEKYNYKERLPQSFPHGLPPSSLEPGATDQQYPPSYPFPDPACSWKHPYKRSHNSRMRLRTFRNSRGSWRAASGRSRRTRRDTSLNKLSPLERRN